MKVQKKRGESNFWSICCGTQLNQTWRNVVFCMWLLGTPSVCKTEIREWGSSVFRHREQHRTYLAIFTDGLYVTDKRCGSRWGAKKKVENNNQATPAVNFFYLLKMLKHHCALFSNTNAGNPPKNTEFTRYTFVVFFSGAKLTACDG